MNRVGQKKYESYTAKGVYKEGDKTERFDSVKMLIAHAYEQTEDGYEVQIEMGKIKPG